MVQPYESLGEFMDKNPRAPILDLKFEDIVRDPKTAITEMANFMEVTVSESFLQDLLIACKFENMKDAPVSDVMRKTRALDPGKFTCYKQGKIGDWVNTFSVAQNELFDTAYRKQMKDSKQAVASAEKSADEYHALQIQFTQLNQELSRERAQMCQVTAEKSDAEKQLQGSMDGFEILREKWYKAWRIHMNGACGIFVDTDFDINMEALRITGPAFADMLEYAHAVGLIWLTDLFKVRFGQDKCQVTLDEAIEVWARFFLQNPRLFIERTLNYWTAIFEAIDLNKDGVISLDEYRVCSYLNRMTDEQVVSVFTLLDTDKNGVITKEEFLESYRRYLCDPTVSNEELPLFG